MIIVQILGGLGNQMFQFAMARSLALKGQHELKIDISELTSHGSHSTSTPRSFALEGYKLTAPLAEKHECDALKYGRGSFVKLWWRHLRGKSRPFGPTCYRERTSRFDERMCRVTGDAYIIGFWQSYKYFESCSHVLREEFTPRRNLSAETVTYLSEIQASNAVSIHVRRGDYVSNPNANAFHGTCDLEYYRRAIKAVEKRIADPRYFIFSDDLEWAKSNLDFVVPATFVEFADHVHEFEEMHLMSQCHHNIIGNSSFSWWGAWLNDHPHRMVVAPKQWFRDPKIDTSDLIPPDWLRL